MHLTRRIGLHPQRLPPFPSVPHRKSLRFDSAGTCCERKRKNGICCGRSVVGLLALGRSLGSDRRREARGGGKPNGGEADDGAKSAARQNVRIGAVCTVCLRRVHFRSSIELPKTISGTAHGKDHARLPRRSLCDFAHRKLSDAERAGGYLNQRLKTRQLLQGR